MALEKVLATRKVDVASLSSLLPELALGNVAGQTYAHF